MTTDLPFCVLYKKAQLINCAFSFYGPTALEHCVKEHLLQHGQLTSFTGKSTTLIGCFILKQPTTSTIIAREKEIKGWTRQKEMDLINKIKSGAEIFERKSAWKWPPQEAIHR